MRKVKKTPYSLTSKEAEALGAASGNFVYVIEVRVEKGARSYWLGYKYQAYEMVRPAGGGLWEGKFKFKNSAKFAEPATGRYFDGPVRLADAALCEWLGGRPPGMEEIPAELVATMDAPFADPANEARSFV